MIGQTMAARRRIVALALGVVGLLTVVGIAIAMPIPPTLTLNAPVSVVPVTQNDSTLGCNFDSNRGYGYAIDFSWTAPPIKNLHRYELVLQHVGGTSPALDVVVTGTSYRLLACNAFVIDTNLTNWYWQVSALNNGHKVLALSEQRALSFAPCRLAGGFLCNAP